MRILLVMEQPATTPKQDIGLARHLRATEQTLDRAAEKYSAACRRHRFGRNPAERAAAKAEAERLRPIVFPDRVFA